MPGALSRDLREVGAGAELMSIDFLAGMSIDFLTGAGDMSPDFFLRMCWQLACVSWHS